MIHGNKYRGLTTLGRIPRVEARYCPTYEILILLSTVKMSRALVVAINNRIWKKGNTPVLSFADVFRI